MTKKTKQTNKTTPPKKDKDQHFFDVANLDKLSPEERKKVLGNIVDTMEEDEEAVLTKDDFLKALKKATRPVSPKASPVKGKKKTSA
jgi:hypothetical protein